jgi:uncharacterized protein (TIGR04255 family)
MDRSSAGATDQRIKFENPPINELVIALYHLPIEEVKAQHIGLYWYRIRDRYPLCRQQPFIESSDTQSLLEVRDEIFPLPRFWFFSDAHPTLIQIQRNAFIFNWRRLMGYEYPHYETVVTDFWRELEIYKTFVQEVGGSGLDVIRRCELTYINIITPNEFFTNPAQLSNVIPPIGGFSDLQTDDRQFVGMNATATYETDPTLRIDCTIQLGRQRNDPQELVSILELKAHGVPSDLSLEGTRSWYNTAHDATYTMFLDITAKQVQERIWKPI